MLERHARLARLLRWRTDGAGEDALRASMASEDQAWLAELDGREPTATPLADLMRDASFDTALTPESLFEEGVVAEDAIDDDWDRCTLAAIGRITSAIEALGSVGPAAEEALPLVLESLKRARTALPYDWAAYFDENPYLNVVQAAARTLGRIGAPVPEIADSVQERGRYSPWYQAFLGMVSAAPEQAAPEAISLLVREGETSILEQIPIERWPSSAVLEAMELDLLDHIRPRVELGEAHLGTLRRLIEKSNVTVQNLARLGAHARIAAPLLEAALREHAGNEAHSRNSRADAAAEALEAVGKRRVEDLASDPEPALRCVAVRVLASRRSGYLTVRERMHDPDTAVRRVAVRGLGAFPGPEVVPVFREALGDPDPDVRRRVLDALASRKVPDLLDVLRHAVDDEDPGVRWTAKWWLRERGAAP